MARRLTEQERENVEAMTSRLIEALPPAQRSFSSGIASALVRMSGNTVTEDDLAHILDKYEEADETVAQVVRDTLLDAVEGQEGVYTLRTPQPVGEDGATDGEDDEGVPSDTSREEAHADAPTDGDTPAGEDVEDGAGPAQDVSSGHGDEDDTTQGAPAPASDDGRGGNAPLPDCDESQGEDGSPEPVPTDDAPTTKPKRSRRRARRTHKTAELGQDARAEDATDADVKVPDTKSKDDSKAQGGKASKESRQDCDRDPQRAGDKSAANGGTNLPSAKQPEKAHRKDCSRDLKKVPYVRRGGETEAEVRQKILNLDQRFWLNGWLLSHPAAYTLYERELLAINDALKDGMLPGDITRRQLAYQMGGDEKFFEYGSDGFRLLRAMGMEDVIRHRPMPKPDLVYYAPRRRKHMRVLVTENLDPYLDVHDLMYEDGRTSILGQRIHAVVLGGGTPILEKNRLALLLDTLGADTVTVLYWGDIDRAGLEIMVKLKEVLGDGYKFRAFTPAYQLMVDKASERFPDPADNETTGQVNIEPMDASLLVDGLTDEAAAYARAVIDDCGLIPQEILTRRDL